MSHVTRQAVDKQAMDKLYTSPICMVLLTAIAWCAGDYSQGLLPVTGAPGIVVPMVSLLSALHAWP